MPKFGAVDNAKRGSHTRDDFRKVLESQGFLCFYCGIPIVEKSREPQCEATEDHLVPLSRGGVDFIWNIVAACLTCNQLKGAMLPGQFLQHRWTIAQLVDPRAHKLTRIPFSKGRVLPYREEELDDEGNLITSHLEVAPVVGSMVRALSHTNRMESQTDTKSRADFLRAQVNHILRNRLEESGQMQLFGEPQKSTERPPELVAQGFRVLKDLQESGALPSFEQIIEQHRKSVASIPPTDEAALTVIGMHVTEQVRSRRRA